MYSSHELCAEAGITYRQLDYWVREGILEVMATAGGHGWNQLHIPGTIPRGSGYPRLYDHKTVTIAKILGDLTRLGLHGKALRRTADDLYRSDPIPHHFYLTKSGTLAPDRPKERAVIHFHHTPTETLAKVG